MLSVFSHHSRLVRLKWTWLDAVSSLVWFAWADTMSWFNYCKYNNWTWMWIKTTGPRPPWIVILVCLQTHFGGVCSGINLTSTRPKTVSTVYCLSKPALSPAALLLWYIFHMCSCLLWSWVRGEAMCCSQDVALNCFQRYHFAQLSLLDISFFLSLPAKKTWFVINTWAKLSHGFFVGRFWFAWQFACVKSNQARWKCTKSASSSTDSDQSKQHWDFWRWTAWWATCFSLSCKTLVKNHEA